MEVQVEGLWLLCDLEIRDERGPDNRFRKELQVAYMLKTDEELAISLRRIAAEQAELAKSCFYNKHLYRDEAVHQARQRCKRIRALLRLLRETHPELAHIENANFRDAAAKLAHVRDVDALSEAFTKFRQRVTAGVSSRVLNEAQRVLTNRRQLLRSADQRPECQIESFIAEMASAVDRVQAWPIEGLGASGLMRGFAQSYRRGRRAMKSCIRTPTNEAYHAWRKWTKYQLYQTQLLRQFLKDSLNHRMVSLKRLGGHLGFDHDMSVFRGELLAAPDFAPVRELMHVGGLLQAVDRQRQRLQTRSLQVGKKVYNPKTDRRIGAYLQCPC